MKAAYSLVGLLARLHDNIDQAAALAQSDVAKHVSHCRRSIAQRFRKLLRDLDHDQNTL
jgi:hypothetical protein